MRRHEKYVEVAQQTNSKMHQQIDDFQIILLKKEKRNCETYLANDELIRPQTQELSVPEV